MTEMTVVRTKGGWAVRFEDGSRTEGMSRLRALARLDLVQRQRAGLADFGAQHVARIAALLASRGIGEVDYRKLHPGDLFTWRPEVAPKTVTEARHFDSGASLIFWDDGRTPAPWAMTLMTPPFPAYGLLRGEG